LMDEFRNNGHDVYVVCNEELKTHNETRLTIENDLHILRVTTGRIKKTAYFRKMISLLMLGSQMQAAIDKYLKDAYFDLIIFNTPPITLSGLIKYLKKKYSCPFYLLLKDMWPQGSVDLEVIKKYGMIWQFFRYHEKRIYRLADYIGCMSPMGVEYIRGNNPFIPKQNVEECPNSIRSSEEEIINTDGLCEKYNIPEGATIFSFSGNMELGHGLYFLADAINQLAEYKKAFFLIGGAGTHFKYLQKAFNEMQPTNAMLYQRLPLEDFKRVTAIVDVGLILLEKKYSVPQFPSRLLTYLEKSKPVLCAVNATTDIGTIAEKNGCGKTVLHGDIEAFIKAVKFFSENVVERHQMGINAKKLFTERYTTANSYNIIMQHFTK